MKQKLKVINLFGGPGTGKSTTRAGLFKEMKLAKMNVEETTEYAKDLTWDEHFNVLADQLFVLANQNRRLDRLIGKVEYVVTDSPLLLSLEYANVDYLPKNFKNLVMEVWDKYDNVNFFLRRVKEYNPVGRNQTEEEARAIDASIYKMLNTNKLPFYEFDAKRDAEKDILELIQRNKI